MYQQSRFNLNTTYNNICYWYRSEFELSIEDNHKKISTLYKNYSKNWNFDSYNMIFYVTWGYYNLYMLPKMHTMMSLSDFEHILVFSEMRQF